MGACEEIKQAGIAISLNRIVNTYRLKKWFNPQGSKYDVVPGINSLIKEKGSFSNEKH